MAINITDFDKIWASSSPLTPYSFTDANYEEGWNFVGATPPARQMWDSLFKWSDEKQQYIVNNFLPLAGGTMTGAIVNNNTVIKHSVDTGFIRIDGGSSDSNGATLSLWGKDHSANAGEFRLRANDGNGDYQLIGRASNGTLTWAGKTILTQGTHIQAGKTSATTVNANSNANVSITFSPAFSSNPVILATVNTGYTGLFVAVGSISTSGASLLISNVSSTNRSVIVGWVAIDI